ncbi:MAG: RNA 2',3'-cyclic phosphodiesterase [Proteobacteria bacterium]|nr:RNA 2',3'-cyclic phosphodiesterase [Pseudomonadota bacterium]
MSDPRATRRVFFALWPGEALRIAAGDAFAAAIAAAGGRAVPPENLHVTLEFLGAVPVARLGELEAIGAAVRLPAAELVLDRLAGWSRGEALVALAGDVPVALAALQSDLRNALRERGFRVDSRAFRPHLTLARKLRAPFTAAACTPLRWPCATLALVASEPHPGGSRYQPLGLWPPAHDA